LRRFTAGSLIESGGMKRTTALPLKGIGVLVTRARDQAAQLVSELESLGAEVHAVPAIETVPILEPAGLKGSLHRIPCYDYLVFTSVNGVCYFLDHLETAGLSPAGLPPAVCVGPRTAEAWRKAGGTVGVVPERYSAKELVGALGDDLPGRSFLVLRPERVKTELAALMREHGCLVDEIILYRTVIGGENAKRIAGLLDRGKLDAVLFASPSAVEGILLMTGGGEKIQSLLAVCIGPVTAETAVEGGLNRVVLPDDYTIEGMVKLLIAEAPELRDRR
jgi:uroporphyrinogen-III synthase